MRACLRLLFCSVLIVVAAPLAAAAAADSCEDAIAELCPDMPATSPERAECVRSGASKLPEDCRRRLVRRRNVMTAGMEALRSACRSEIDHHCDEVRRGGGRLQRCLRALNEAERGKTCSGYLDTLKAFRAIHPVEPAGESEP